jgi:hypothetical protein
MPSAVVKPLDGHLALQRSRLPRRGLGEDAEGRSNEWITMNKDYSPR